jgi:hypothetical protein
MLLAAPVCGSTVPKGTAGESSFTLAFDNGTGSFTIGVDAPCDPARGGHCCLDAPAPIPPEFNYLLIKPSGAVVVHEKAGSAIQLATCDLTRGVWSRHAIITNLASLGRALAYRQPSASTPTCSNLPSPEMSCATQSELKFTK